MLMRCESSLEIISSIVVMENVYSFYLLIIFKCKEQIRLRGRVLTIRIRKVDLEMIYYTEK